MIVVLTAGLTAQVFPSPEALLKAAQERELVDGDLPSALAQYQLLVERFPKHALAADAMLRLAAIHERQGQHAEAREAYERIVREFPRSQPASIARTRLAAGQESRFRETELTVTGKASGMLGRGRVSPDGRFISFEDQLTIEAGGTGNLAIWDTQSGATTIVNRFSNARPWADGFAESSAWSPDGSDLAYTWRVEGGGSNRELRIVSRQTGRHRVVHQTGEGVTWVAPLAWSPDAKHILAVLGIPAGEGTVRSAELALVSTADGAKKTLKTFDGAMPEGATFSPDGRFIAYDFQTAGDSPARDVFVISADGARETPVAADRSTHDRLLGWLPDGHLLFTSDRSGIVDAMAVRMVNGTPQGSAFVVKRGVGPIEPLGITKTGSVFVQKVVDVREIYIAELDPATGRAVRPPSPLPRTQPSGLRTQPAWSPDGSRIAYVQSAPGVPQSVVVQTMSTNAVRVYPVPVRNIDWPLWQPDGRGFTFDGTGEDNVQRTFKLDLESGTVSPFSDSIVAGLSPDGEYLYGETRQRRGLLRRRLSDGTTTVVIPRDEQAGNIGGITLSPDGRWLAYLRGPRGNRELAVRPSAGGEPRVIDRDIRASYPRLAWTPDNRYVIFSMNWDDLYRVPIDGGPRESLGIEGRFGIIRQRSMNVDGRRLAFAAAGTHRELWRWDNVVARAGGR